jgi:hypothetical protein
MRCNLRPLWIQQDMSLADNFLHSTAWLRVVRATRGVRDATDLPEID